MPKIVSLNERRKDRAYLRELSKSIDVAQDRAVELDQKFLAYLLGLARMEIATRIAQEER